MPSNGSKVLIRKMYSTLVRSASHPKKADPMPPSPNDNPKNMPATMPTLPGMSSVAYTRMAENAEEMTRPMITESIIVRGKLE